MLYEPSPECHQKRGIYIPLWCSFILTLSHHKPSLIRETKQGTGQFPLKVGVWSIVLQNGLESLDEVLQVV